MLSACETGLGQSAGGEGLLGLQRAFHAAGARSVVASLWSVADEPTRALMSRFYANLWGRRMSKLEALIEAQRWMLREGRAHPGVARGFRAEERDRARRRRPAAAVLLGRVRALGRLALRRERYNGAGRNASRPRGGIGRHWGLKIP